MSTVPSLGHGSGGHQSRKGHGKKSPSRRFPVHRRKTPRTWLTCRGHESLRGTRYFVTDVRATRLSVLHLFLVEFARDGFGVHVRKHSSGGKPTAQKLLHLGVGNLSRSETPPPGRGVGDGNHDGKAGNQISTPGERLKRLDWEVRDTGRSPTRTPTLD